MLGQWRFIIQRDLISWVQPPWFTVLYWNNVPKLVLHYFYATPPVLRTLFIDVFVVVALLLLVCFIFIIHPHRSTRPDLQDRTGANERNEGLRDREREIERENNNKGEQWRYWAEGRANKLAVRERCCSHCQG